MCLTTHSAVQPGSALDAASRPGNAAENEPAAANGVAPHATLAGHSSLGQVLQGSFLMFLSCVMCPLQILHILIMQAPGMGGI